MPALKPTGEQQAILDAAGMGGAVSITAAAGTGKTSTLRLIAEARPNTRMLYVAYNRAIADEAAGTFANNVTCKTAHALAYRQFGAPMRRRLNGPRMTGAQNAAALGITSPFGLDAERVFRPAAVASWALGMVMRFCRTADPAITTRHFRAPEGLTPAEEKQIARYLLPLATKAWADLTGGDRGRLKPTHDIYLKQWQLSQPRLTGWDVILYDEAQDADPCISAVVERQGHAQLIAVGDSAQAIYGWRGAGDFLARMSAEHHLRLTQSWRFGQAVAEEANVWLGVVGTDMRVVGNPARDSRLDTLTDADAVLCRSNAGTIDQLLAAHAAGTRVHLVGDGKDMRALAEAAERLQDGRPAGHPELTAFTTWQQVVEYAENDPAGTDLAVAVRMIEKYEPDEVIRAIDGTVPDARAELRVSTAHKSKGLEWGRVRIGNDYREPLDKQTGQPLPIPREDAMLAYVAVTRAKDILDNAGLAWVHAHLEALATPPGETVDRELTPPVPLPLPAEAPAEEPGLVETANGCLLCTEHAETWRYGGNGVARRPNTPDDIDPETEYQCADCHDLESATAEPAEARHPSPAPASKEPGSGRDGSGVDLYLARYGIRVGAPILVADEPGVYVVHGLAKDGSVTAYRPDRRGGARNFRPEWCCPATRPGKNGKPVKVRSVPPACRIARAAWRAQHTPAAMDVLPAAVHGLSR